MLWALQCYIELTPNEREGASGEVFLAFIAGAVFLGWIAGKIERRK